MHWRQIVVLAEIIILAVCGFIPSGKCKNRNNIVNHSFKIAFCKVYSHKNNITCLRICKYSATGNVCISIKKSKEEYGEMVARVQRCLYKIHGGRIVFVRLIYVFNLRISIMELNEKIREKQMSENFILGIMLALTIKFRVQMQEQENIVNHSFKIAFCKVYSQRTILPVCAFANTPPRVMYV